MYSLSWWQLPLFGIIYLIFSFISAVKGVRGDAKEEAKELAFVAHPSAHLISFALYLAVPVLLWILW